MAIGELIASYREKNGLSQQKVADYLNIKRESLSYYENNEREAPLDVLERLADLYGADLTDFFETDPQLIQNNIAFAFRAEEIQDGDLPHLESFRKVVKNYFKICKLEEKNVS
ncbi:helix-turn-helix transcriptional regulator [Pedobacter sp. PLR]|uniref:helix-turn-helix domain-containing protein n=1 Tax=Pedobacter sp. PLR TaxID=2994465 RepID=UPI002247BA1C|nr:helix-turn-helix transcriptional regulator [Pedobacter sp. PLR]MCX2453636.1 helix-turn-helix transcriptional regulator [Pedobacter sp. PLR]